MVQVACTEQTQHLYKHVPGRGCPPGPLSLRFAGDESAALAEDGSHSGDRQ